MVYGFPVRLDFVASAGSDMELRVAADQTEKLRDALGAKSGEDTFDVVLSRFEDGTISPWVSLPKWLG